MKQVYAVDGVVVAVGWAREGVKIVPNEAKALLVAEVADDTLIGPGWIFNFGAEGIAFHPPGAPPPTVSVNEFYFLWTMAERVALEEIRKTDVGLDLFMRSLDDPRTTEVVLADPAIQEAVRHAVATLAVVGVIATEAADARAATIIGGGATIT